jgi:methylglutaconyl-CoA hydratase
MAGAMDPLQGNPVRVTVERGVMTATLADAPNRNALGAALVQGLRDAIATANRDPALRALVVTNEGNTFCAGANLKERSAASEARSEAQPSGVQKERARSEAKPSEVQKAAAPGRPAGAASGQNPLVALLEEIQASPTPVIGRIAGHVMGGGNGLAAAFDISIAADDVKFGFTEVRLGVAPAIISVVCLPKMRPAEAMEAFLRGHRFSAARAVELGLINRAVPAAELDAAVAEVLADLRRGGPNALGFCKRLVREVPAMSQKEAFAWTAALSADLFASKEAAEGMAAFLQRRPAAWAKEED